MKTKTLLFSALTMIAALTSAQADTAVYSVNAVGYVNVSVPAGQFVLVSNPVSQPTNTINAILPSAPDNTTKIFLFDGAGYVLFTKRSTGWAPNGGTTIINPGVGMFVQNTAATNITLTFVGDVLQSTASGPLSNSIPAGYSLVASQVPQAGLVETQLGLPAQNNDKVYKFVGGTYQLFTRRTSTWSSPGEPSVAVAEGFFFQTAAAKTWVRDFNVNQ